MCRSEPWHEAEINLNTHHSEREHRGGLSHFLSRIPLALSHTCCVSLGNLHSTSNFSLRLFALSSPLPLAVLLLILFYLILFQFQWIPFIHQPCVLVGLITAYRVLGFGMLSVHFGFFPSKVPTSVFRRKCGNLTTSKHPLWATWLDSKPINIIA